MVVNRFEVWLVNLDPTVGSEIRKTRPCIIISPNEANKYLNTVIAAPLTSVLRNYPTRLSCIFKRKKGQIALDQMRALDKIRLIRKLGIMDENICRKLCLLLIDFFSFE